MFPSMLGFKGPLSGSNELFYFIKTLHFFEDIVHNEAKEQKIPKEILRVLKPCRGCLIFSREAVYCVLAFQGDNDPIASTLMTEDYRNRTLDIKEAERIGIRWIFSDGSHGDPLTLRFPIECYGYNLREYKGIIIDNHSEIFGFRNKLG